MVDRTLYLSLRRMGLRAVVAFGIAKYGIMFAIELLLDEDLNASSN